MIIRAVGMLAVMAATVSVPLTITRASSDRAPIVEGIELQVLTAPATVRLSGALHLPYELHVTNLRSTDIVVSRLQVLDARSRAPIADYQGDAVARRFGRPGRGRGERPAHVIGPGMRAVAYLWIEVGKGSAASPAPTTPAALLHRLDVEITQQQPQQAEANAMRVAVEGGASTVSEARAIAIAPPLRGGPWVAIYDPEMQGGHRRATYTVDGRTRIPGRFAVDWIRVPPDGTLERGPGPRSPEWNGFGADVLAVADAMVVEAMDDMADNPDPAAASTRSASSTRTPVPLEKASGNYVTLDLGQGRFAFYEHLKSGTVTVKPGMRVRTGQVIGRLGNSGSTSSGPHLHFHVADARAPLGAEGLPFVFTAFEQLGAFASIEALGAGDPWQRLSHTIAHTREFPAPNAVVRFP